MRPMETGVCFYHFQVGIYDEPKKEAVKLYCPRCGDVYNTVSPYGGEREAAIKAGLRLPYCLVV